MAHHTAILVSLVALFSFGHADMGFDYLMLSLEWPPSFCKTKDCDFPNSALKGWNVHGLWPSNFHKHYPEYCPGTSYDPDRLEPIRSLLQENWADLLDYNSPDEFWKREWKKHGECCSKDPQTNTELKYFNATIQLKLALDVVTEMRKRSIVPSDDKTYQISDIEAAMRDAYGVTVNLRCVENDDDTYLIETRFCFSPSLAPINCPEESKLRKSRLGTDECGDTVKYPTFDSINSINRRLVMRWKRLQRGSRLQRGTQGFDHL